MKLKLFTPTVTTSTAEETKTSIATLAASPLSGKSSSGIGGVTFQAASSEERENPLEITSNTFAGGGTSPGTVYNAVSLPGPTPNATQPPGRSTLPPTGYQIVGLTPMEKIVYSDYTFEITQPQYKGFIAANGSRSSLWFDFASVYNFHIQSYERATTRFEEIEGASLVPEHLLPNLYVFLAELDQAQLDPVSVANAGDFYRHITLTNDQYIPSITDVLKDVSSRSVATMGSLSRPFKKRNIAVTPPGSPSSPQTPFLGSEQDNASYYEEWAQAINTIRTQAFNATFSPSQPGLPTQEIRPYNTGLNAQLANSYSNLDVFKNIIVPTIGLPLLNDLSERRRMFPMWVNVEFNTDYDSKFGGGLISQAFQDLGLTALLMKEVVEDTEIKAFPHPSGDPKLAMVVPYPWHKWMQLDRASNLEIVGEDPDKPNLSHGSYSRTWDIGKFLLQAPVSPHDLNVQGEVLNEDLISNKWVLLNDASGRTTHEVKLCGGSSGLLCNVQQKQAALDNVRTVIKGAMTPGSPYWRTHKEILEGKKAYSETVFYKIEKRVLTNSEDPEGTVVQNIYLPNAQATLSYIDTQVTYGVKYKYRIYAYQMVCGNKYRYKVNNMPTSPTDGRYTIFFEKNSEPSGLEGSIDVHTGEVVTVPQEGFYGKDWITFVNKIFTANEFTNTENPTGPQDREVVSNNSADALYMDSAEVCALSEVSMILVEVPQFEFDTTVVDQPPVAPDVDLVPYRAISDKMLINLNGGTGTYVRPFKIMKDTDQDYLDSYVLNQKAKIQGEIDVLQQGSAYQRPPTPQIMRRSPRGGLFGVPLIGGSEPLPTTAFSSTPQITFRSDDPSTQFEIWRTDSKPEKWTDFKIVETIDSSKFFDKPDQKAASAAFVDDIKPNKKYWYTFRAIDIHGNVSDPTTVYEIMMHDDNGTVWLDINLFPDSGLHVGELGPVDLRTPSKMGQRFIQIKPSAMQTTINERESDFIDQATGNRIPSLRPFNLTGDPAVLGSSMEIDSLWSGESSPEKFKIRLTSKKTGRKMDLNFYSTVKHIKNPQVKLKK